MASLRARLVAAVLVLATLGLLTLGAVTYAEQRSFLYDRADEQARSAIEPVHNSLEGHDFGFGQGGGRPPRGLGGPPDDRGRNERGVQPGTYGELRDAAGKVLKHSVLDPFSEGITATPDIPAQITPGVYRTISGEGSDDRHYRLYATAGADGLTTVVAVPLGAAESLLDRLLLVEGLVIGGVLLALAAAAWFVVRVGLLPLDRMTHTAGRIAGGDLSHRVEATDPRTEVGRLGVAFNAMLDRLETAFAHRQRSEHRLRQFIADASHELRTPLASIRGYAELYRMGAVREPDELARSMRRIEEEGARMGVLVEDLLTLARLDEVTEQEHADVDLARLVRDAVQDAHATAPERAITAHGPDHALVRGDEHRLRQVLANLMRNALVHTPAGTPIEVHLVEDDDSVAVAVRDHGPGLPTDDPDALFERFWRAEGGRERGLAGAGLGLAIVAAVVKSHGGSVAAANAAGGGAVFTVTLPRALPS